VANAELAKRVTELREQGAPDWGIALYIEMTGLREDFGAHCVQHETEKQARRWWGGLGEKILLGILIPMSAALAYGLIRFLATRLP